ncbi:RHS repeat-associated core domain-containing protein [Streptomyces sp. NPDC094034]|uniref:RHS repeat-associated core domain-containing protein n=1 Tax=Streptomyces sp. NPDC094034 TaxID=3155309 RepID=UPI003319CE26
MITKDADGSQTLTLPAGNELKTTSAGTKEAVRYYTHGGETVAVRTSNGFSFLLPDHQGTAMAAIAMTSLTVTRRKQLPFGQTRTQESTQIPGTRGFIGGTNDPTGLTHLGAREYDPALGRFLSVDPVIDINTPAQMNAYSYAHNTPITQSDPTGLCPADLCGNGYPIGGTGQVKGDPVRYVKNASTGNRYHIGSYIGTNGKAITTPGKKSPQVAQAQARARAAEQAEADARAAAQAKAAKDKADAERRKRDSVFGSISHGISSTVSKMTSNRFLTHAVANMGVGTVADLVAVAACAGTAGLGCVVIAGAMTAALIGTPTNLAIDKAYGHQTTGPEAVGYLAGSLPRGGFQGAVRMLTGKSPLMYYMGQAWGGIRR